MSERHQQRLLQSVKGGALYFALVFGAGFVLGTIRVLLVAPSFGERTAELIESPIMVVVVVLAARWAVGRLAPFPSVAVRLGVGGIALGLLLIAELTVVVWLRGLAMTEYFASRDPVAGTVYVLMLIVFAVMPLLVARRPTHHEPQVQE